MYVKTEEQTLFGVYIDGNIDDKLKELINSVFENIVFFEIEIGYQKSLDKSYLTLKEKAEKGKFDGIIIFEKNELIQEKLETEIIEYDYLCSDAIIKEWIKMYMSDN